MYRYRQVVCMNRLSISIDNSCQQIVCVNRSFVSTDPPYEHVVRTDRLSNSIDRSHQHIIRVTDDLDQHGIPPCVLLEQTGSPVRCVNEQN